MRLLLTCVFIPGIVSLLVKKLQLVMIRIEMGNYLFISVWTQPFDQSWDGWWGFNKTEFLFSSLLLMYLIYIILYYRFILFKISASPTMVTTSMKSLCFSNQTEGLNVNVIACGLSNGRIRFYSTWDLTLLREISVQPEDSGVGCIISLKFTRDRLYASDTYAKNLYFRISLLAC